MVRGLVGDEGNCEIEYNGILKNISIQLAILVRQFYKSMQDKDQIAADIMLKEVLSLVNNPKFFEGPEHDGSPDNIIDFIEEKRKRGLL